MRRLLLAALALVVLAACSEDDPAMRPSTTTRVRTGTEASSDVLTPAFPPVVGAFGDSLLAAAHEELAAGIDEDVRLVNEALVGVTIQGGTFGLERLKKQRPAGTAVVLGTNNAMDGPDPDDLTALRELMADVSGLPCVRWVEVTTSGPDDDFNRAARAMNAELHRLAARYATVEIVPWADAVAAHPEWVEVDDVHHTRAGEEALAAAILDALAACPETRIRR